MKVGDNEARRGGSAKNLRSKGLRTGTAIRAVAMSLAALSLSWGLTVNAGLIAASFFSLYPRQVVERVRGPN